MKYFSLTGTFSWRSTKVKLTRTQEFDLYEFSEESLAEDLNTENKEAEHVKDSDT